jgi:NADH-quinone oxidoreductase subunit G
VRFFETVEGKSQITVVDRGDRSTVGTFRDRPLTGNYQGNLADICPVGALTLKGFRFDTRVWDLQKTNTVCGLCSRGCNTIVETKRDTVRRIRPRHNPEVNGWWMCDEGRLEFADLNWSRNDGRIFEPHVVGPAGVLAPAPLEAAIAEAARLLAEAGPDVVAICSPFATCEEGVEFKRAFAFAKTVCFFDPGRVAEDDGILHTDDPCPNRRGLTEVAGLAPLTAGELQDALPAARAVFLGGERSTQLLPDSLKVAMKDVPSVVIHTRRLENLTFAKVAIPCLSSAEKWGTWVNVTGVRQQVAASLPLPKGVRPDLHVLETLRNEMGRTVAGGPVP